MTRRPIPFLVIAVALAGCSSSGGGCAGTGVHAGLLGTTKRAGGMTDVTYHGHPLSRFTGDQQAGDTSGQGSDRFGPRGLCPQPDRPSPPPPHRP